MIRQTRAHTDRLNHTLMQNACGSSDTNYLASPVTGGGIIVGRFQQLFLLAMKEGKQQAAEQAEFVWQILAKQGQKLLKEGQTLGSAEENIAELTLLAQTFAEKQLPILQALQVV